MNTVLSSYGQLCGCPEILKKSCKFFCRGLDIRVTKLVEATNGHFLVEAENEIWYDIARGYSLHCSLFH